MRRRAPLQRSECRIPFWRTPQPSTETKPKSNELGRSGESLLKLFEGLSGKTETHQVLPSIPSGCKEGPFEPVSEMPPIPWGVQSIFSHHKQSKICEA